MIQLDGGAAGARPDLGGPGRPGGWEGVEKRHRVRARSSLLSWRQLPGCLHSSGLLGAGLASDGLDFVSDPVRQALSQQE